jgi:hypothetical protein
VQRCQPRAFALNNGVGFAEVIQDPEDHGGIGGITAARSLLDKFPRACQKRSPVVRAEPRLRGNR